MRMVPIALWLVSAACGAEGTSTTPVHGEVVDELGHAIEGATAALTTRDGQVAALTGADGSFALSSSDVAGTLVLEVSASGFGRTWVRRLASGGPVDLSVRLKALPPGAAVTLPPVGQSVTVRDGRFSATIPGGALCDDTGRPLTGEVEVAFLAYDPFDARFGASFVTVEAEPGLGKLTQRSASGEVDVVITRAGQQVTKVCDGQSITLGDTITGPNPPASFVWFLDQSSATMEHKIAVAYDESTHETTVQTRDLVPHCPDACSKCPNQNACIDGYCTYTVCGDGLCNWLIGESCRTCPGDCGACAPAPRCGDGACNGSDTCESCPADCGACAAAAKCGDGACNGSESCASCAQDCGACGPKCGDGTCNGAETCSSCGDDCGPCAMPATVHGTIKDVHGKPTVVAVTASTRSLMVGQLSSDADGRYGFALGSTISEIEALIEPGARPGLRLQPTPAWRKFHAGDNTLDFQYCLPRDEQCRSGDLCCDGARCVDGLCGS